MPATGIFIERCRHRVRNEVDKPIFGSIYYGGMPIRWHDSTVDLQYATSTFSLSMKYAPSKARRRYRCFRVERHRLDISFTRKHSDVYCGCPYYVRARYGPGASVRLPPFPESEPALRWKIDAIKIIPGRQSDHGLCTNTRKIARNGWYPGRLVLHDRFIARFPT